MATTASKIIKLAQSWIGKKESDGSHKEIIDIYNSHKPLARGYKVKYTDSWCAATISALAIKLGATDIIPTECSCQKLIELFKKLGVWVENENRTPNKGDIIFYDWQDNGKGDNKGWSDHVGIVEKVSGSTIKVIEGNYDNAVKRRTIKVNAKNIRGYAVPKYDAEPVVSTGTSATTSEVKIDYASGFNKSYARTYTTTANLNLRTGAGTSKKKILVIPKGAKVRCFGYYSMSGNTTWLCVEYEGQKGFCSKNYLK